MNAIILSVGNELVLGQTVDTNSAWLAARLAASGWDVISHQTVGDDEAAIVSAITEAAGRCNMLIVSGGLGPTKDDLTRQALARVLRQPLETDPRWMVRMEAIFQRLNRVMAESNKVQALIPRGARMVPNEKGTAAGIDADFQSPTSSRTCRIFVVPGVPSEMKGMFTAAIEPELAKAGGGRAIVTRTLHTFGLGESTIGEKLGDLMDRARNPSVGTTVSDGGVSLRITSRAADRNEAVTALEQTVSECRRALGDLIYGQEEETLPSVVAGLLTQKAVLKVSTAESCTGGLLAKMLTDIPGSSRYFQRGWITYSNEAKTEMLGVDPALIARYGAVSEEVVQAMSRSARVKSGADFGIAISGVAGPDGGTAAKPVGTVCIALSHGSGEIMRTFGFHGDRAAVRDRSAKMALTLLRFHLSGLTTPF